MINNIKFFLYRREANQMNQALIRYNTLFQRYIIHNWVGTDNSNRFEDLNKIIIYHYMYFYQKCWTNRNEIAHDDKRQKEQFVEWYKSLLNEGKSDRHSEIRKYANTTELNLNTVKMETIKLQIYKYKEFRRKVDKYIKNNDIRRFFATQY